MTEHFDVITKDQAARAMLAALKDMTDAHELLYHPQDRNRAANHIARIANARAAIAQAEAAGIKAEG